MANKSLKTGRYSSQIGEKVSKWAAGGRTLAQIADSLAGEGISTTPKTVSRWIKRYEREIGEPVPRRRRRDRRNGPSKVSRDETPAESLSPPSVTDALNAIRDVLGRVDDDRVKYLLGGVMAERLAELDNMRRGAAEMNNPNTYAKVVQLEAELVRGALASVPPPPVDPVTDPRNVEARDAVVEKLEHLAKKRREAILGCVCAGCRAAVERLV